MGFERAKTEAVDRGEDVVGGLGPAEWLGFGVVGVDIGMDRGFRGISRDRTCRGLSARCAATLRDYLQDNIARKIRVADLSALANLSPYHFVRAFRRSFGLPPHQYLTRGRIERAKRLLADTSQSTTAISLAVGLGGSSHFATTFKAVTGISPLTYRRSVIGD